MPAGQRLLVRRGGSQNHILRPPAPLTPPQASNPSKALAPNLCHHKLLLPLLPQLLLLTLQPGGSLWAMPQGGHASRSGAGLAAG
jgi:hypothetical protein